MTNKEYGEVVDQFTKEVWERFDALAPDEQAQINRWLERDLVRAGIL